MKIFLIIFLTIFIGACSSSNESVKTENLNRKKVNDNSDANINVISNENSTVVPYNSKIAPNLANSKNITKVIPKVNKENPEGKPAPDNSTVETSFNAEGFRVTRTFKDHPTLLKVEKTEKGKVKTFKVYLKSGKVYDVTDEKLPNFKVTSSGNILAAIGLVKVNPEKVKQKSEMQKQESDSANQ